MLENIFLIYLYTYVFVQKGKDVLLGVKEDGIPKYLFIFQWTFKVDKSLMTFSLGREPPVSDDYSGSFL